MGEPTPAQPDECSLGEMHGFASTFTNESGVRCCDFCGRPVQSTQSNIDVLELVENLNRFVQWARAKDPNATIWLHGVEAATALETLEARVKVLESALAQAAVPLEGLLLCRKVGAVELSEHSWGEVENGVQHIRAALLKRLSGDGE